MTMRDRKHVVAMAPWLRCARTAATLLCAIASQAYAQSYPTKPIRLIVPYSAGAGTDTTARIVAAKLTDKWGQQVVVDNRTGAGGAIGVEYTANANPDGYTLCLITASQAVVAASGQKLSYDILKDLRPITQITSVFYVVYVPPSLPVKTIKELISYAKANPGKLNFASSGVGSLQHVGGELLNHMAGIKMVHITYRGAANIIPAMLANEVQVGFNSMFGVRPQVQAGRLRWLAITAAKRAPIVDLPTVAEAGLPGYEVDQWYAMVTAARAPTAIVSTLHRAIVEALQATDVAQRLSADGSIIVGSTPEQLGAYIRSDMAKWKKLVKEANLQLH
jgi:tripartite-type tricarboxylate transporter receptor subunit TctC